MSLYRLLQASLATLIGSSRVWLHPLIASLASATVLAFALIGERKTLTALMAQLEATTVSSSFVQLVSDAQDRLSTIAIVLLPVLLALLLLWLERLARMVLVVQRMQAPSFPHPHGTLLKALVRFGVLLLLVIGVLAIVVPLPATAPQLLALLAGLIVFAAVTTVAFVLVVLVRPSVRALLRHARRVLWANKTTFLALLVVTAVELLVACSLLGFPLHFALKLHAYSAALLSGGIALLLLLPLLVLHVVSWSIFTLAGIERQSARTPAAAAA